MYVGSKEVTAAGESMVHAVYRVDVDMPENFSEQLTEWKHRPILSTREYNPKEASLRYVYLLDIHRKRKHTALQQIWAESLRVDQ